MSATILIIMVLLVTLLEKLEKPSLVLNFVKVKCLSDHRSTKANTDHIHF